MKTKIITEFVNFKLLETATEEQLLTKADVMVNGFLKKQDGFIDAELLKDVSDNAWCFIIRYENMEVVKPIVENLRNCKEFGELKLLFIPGSIGVSFNRQLKRW